MGTAPTVDYRDPETDEPLGHWVKITGEEYTRRWYKERIQHEALVVFSTITDPQGLHGEPVIYTEWGVKDSPVPLLACHRWGTATRADGSGPHDPDTHQDWIFEVSP